MMLSSDLKETASDVFIPLFPPMSLFPSPRVLLLHVNIEF